MAFKMAGWSAFKKETDPVTGKDREGSKKYAMHKEYKQLPKEIPGATKGKKGGYTPQSTKGYGATDGNYTPQSKPSKKARKPGKNTQEMGLPGDI